MEIAVVRKNDTLNLKNLRKMKGKNRTQHHKHPNKILMFTLMLVDSFHIFRLPQKWSMFVAFAT
jgi:hypothetical protein